MSKAVKISLIVAAVLVALGVVVFVIVMTVFRKIQQCTKLTSTK